MGLFTWVTKRVTNELMDEAMKRLSKDGYVENLFEMIPSSKKVTPIALMEIAMRATQGRPPGRPLGSHYRFSHWEQLLFNPVHLMRMPIPEDQLITTEVIIGPQAKKPLHLSIPIVIAAMSFGGALSKSAKIALARAATATGTATNTGEAGLLPEERQAAALLIGQYNRGGWLNEREKYEQLDAIEIQLGQGAQGSTPQRTRAQQIGEDFRRVFELREGQDAIIHSRLPGVDSPEDFVQLVRRLKSEVEVPVGLKIAATHYLEDEMRYALEAGCDFITVDGAEGGTHAAAPTMEDDLGLPTMWAVSRAAKYLHRQGAKGTISLLAAGGLITPGEFMKAMALGADAVYTGTAAVMALVANQMDKALPFEPPTDLVVYSGKMTDRLDIDQATQGLTNFLQACVSEMQLLCTSLGRPSLQEVTREDLCCLDPYMAKALGVDIAYVPSQQQEEYFRQWPLMPGSEEVNSESSHYLH